MIGVGRRSAPSCWRSIPYASSAMGGAKRFTTLTGTLATTRKPTSARSASPAIAGSRLPLPRRREQGSFKLPAPPEPDTKPHRGNLASWISPPLRHRLPLASPSDPMVRTPVVEVLSHRYPSAVLRAIALVVVRPVNGQAMLVAVSVSPLREGLIAGSPLLTDGDTPSAVAGVCLVVGVVASRLHRPPDVIEFGM